MLVSTQSWSPPAFDEAVSSAVLTRADRGEQGATLRVFIPDRAVVFGRQDCSRPGFAAAVAAAEDAGFAPVLRLAGGRAAVFHEGTVAISMALPDASPRDSITDRFLTVSSAVAAAVAAAGAPAEVGEVPGEYCPGTYSVNLGGKSKVAGLGQRLRRRAAHVGGVVVVEGSESVNRVLEPVYRHLGYSWDPEATGAISDAAPIGPEEFIPLLVDALTEPWPGALPGPIEQATIDLARTRVADHDLAIA